MIVRANKKSDYIFLPSYGELLPFRQKYGQFTKSKGDGFTLLIYAFQPRFLIAGKTYTVEGLPYIPAVTVEFDTATETLNYMGLAVSVDNGQVLDKTKGLLTRGSQILDHDDLGFKLKGMPQLFGVYKLNGGDRVVITGINGDYDFKNNLFHGVLDVQSYDLFLLGA